MIPFWDFNPITIRFWGHYSLCRYSAWFYMDWGTGETLFGGMTRRDGAPNDWIESAKVAGKRGMAIWSKGLTRFSRPPSLHHNLENVMKQLATQGKTE
jgi:hypothetical protein